MSKHASALRETYLRCQESLQKKESLNKQQKSMELKQETICIEQESSNEAHMLITANQESIDLGVTIKQESLEPSDDNAINTFASVWVKIEEENNSASAIYEPEELSGKNNSHESCESPLEEDCPSTNRKSTEEPLSKKPRISVAVQRLSAEGELNHAISSILGTPAVPSPIHLMDSDAREIVTSSSVPCKKPRRTSKQENNERQAKPLSKDEIINIGSEDELEPCNYDSASFVPRCQRILLASGDNEDIQNELKPMKEEPSQMPESVHISNLSETTAGKIHWRPFPKKLIPPQERQEFFNMPQGPKIPLANPYAAFTAIWDRQIMELIAEETNKYAEETLKYLASKYKLSGIARLDRWSPTNADELYVYFGVILAMGHCHRIDEEEFWTCKGINETPNYPKLMPYNRYVLINKFLHFTDNNSIPKNLNHSEARLFKIKPIIEYLNKKFQSLYSLNRNIVVEESLTHSATIDQLVKNKNETDENRDRLRSYEVCDAKSGYIWRFEINGPDEKERRLCLRKKEIILSLLKGLEKKGHCVYMDDVFIDPMTVRTLKSKGFDCVGQLHNKYFPKELSSNLNLSDVQGWTSGDMDIILWPDKKKVGIISTYHGNTMKVRDDTCLPIAISDYKTCMAWLDRKDQKIAMFPVERRKSHGWYKKFFRRLLNASVLNSFILFIESAVHSAPYCANYKQFRQDLFESLFKNFPVGSIPTMSSSSVKLSPEFFEHLPAEYEALSSRKEHRVCAICRQRAETYCPGCKVTLCAFGCHGRYHLGK